MVRMAWKLRLVIACGAVSLAASLGSYLALPAEAEDPTQAVWHCPTGESAFSVQQEDSVSGLGMGPGGHCGGSGWDCVGQAF